MTYYWLHGTRYSGDSVLAGYSTAQGFKSDVNGFDAGATWLCSVLSDFTDNSWLFAGGSFQIPDDHGGFIYREYASFSLELDDDPTYTVPDNPPYTGGEATRTNIALPAYPHYWKMLYRWRCVGGIPAGRKPTDPALTFEMSSIAGAAQARVTRTYEEAPPKFRTDTCIIQRPVGALGASTNYLAGVGGEFSTDARKNDPFGAGQLTPGPVFLPVQVAWVSLTGPIPIVQQPSFIPGYRRSFFI